VWVQQFDATTNTVMAQQTCLLLQQGKQNPNPHKQFLTNLINQIHQWQQQHKEVLIGMDVNEDLNDPNSKVMRIFAETDLIDLHYHHYPGTPKPATHQHGSYPIDVIIGSPLLATALTHAWILPFGQPPLIKGDHWLLGLDFSPDILFGSHPATPSPGILRGINSHHKQQVQQYCKKVVTQCNKHQLAECTAILLDKDSLSANDIHELEQINMMLMKILMHTDQQCCQLSIHPWSPTIQTAYLIHHFWALTRMAKQTERDLSEALTQIEHQLQMC